MSTPEVWYTADSHWNHRNMVELKWRPFDSVPEMNDALLTGWNDNVRPQDIVYHLGDWGMGPAVQHLDWLNRVNGTVHLITGNHDAPWSGHRDALKVQKLWLTAGFASISAFARKRIDGHNVLMSHFPYEGDGATEDRYSQFRLRDEGLPLLHGHVHDLWAARGRQYNVGVDVHGWAPVPQDMIAAWLGALAEDAA